VGVSRPTIWSWESAKSRPHKSTLAKLATALGVTEQEILGGTEVPGPADINDQQLSPSLDQLQIDSTETLAEVISRAKAEIARCAGTTSPKIRVIIEL
jgi:transcriptional regulator with XRE-family HTH domain